jgi:hypothetical protein
LLASWKNWLRAINRHVVKARSKGVLHLVFHRILERRVFSSFPQCGAVTMGICRCKGRVLYTVK